MMIVFDLNLMPLIRKADEHIAIMGFNRGLYLFIFELNFFVTWR